MLHWPFILVLIHLVVIVRALLIEGRDPYSRLAWVLALLLFPIASIVAYLLLGEPWVSGRFRRQADRAYKELAKLQPDTLDDDAMKAIAEADCGPFQVIQHISRFAVTSGNTVALMADSNDAIAEMVAAMAAAKHRIHLTTYIWLTDRNGRSVVDALIAAAKRGVKCRVCADAIGSRLMIRAPQWEAMKQAGVQLCPSLGREGRLSFIAAHRIDLRNHRKILIIDGRVAFVGSQNLADPEFRIKAKFAPWVDIMLRVEGPVVAQNDILFASDWVVEKGEDLSRELCGAPVTGTGDVTAVAFGTGPLSHRGAMSDAFVSLLYAANEEVVITTPYFVPDPPLLAALLSCGRRGVKTSLILPRRNDSRVIGAISRALYPQLIDAGVSLFEYRPGLLHSKTMVVDGALCLLGSSNMDRRSLELNFENNLLFHSRAVAALIRERQNAYLANSTAVDADTVRNRSVFKRLADNVLTMAGALF